MNARITGRQAIETMKDIRESDATQVFNLLRHVQSNCMDYLATLAWLYGREPDTHHPDNGTWWDTREYFLSQGALGITLFDGSGESRTLDAEQATDLARALLNAAERMENPK